LWAEALVEDHLRPPLHALSGSWSLMALAEVAHRPSVPLGKLLVNRVSSPRQFPVWLTGRQCTCTTRHPSQHWVSTPWLTGPQYPMPALSAARPLGNIHFFFATRFTVFATFFKFRVLGLPCSGRPSLHLLTCEPCSSCHPSRFQPPPLVLNGTPLILAGSRPATDPID
jgi:hypothetical protein